MDCWQLLFDGLEEVRLVLRRNVRRHPRGLLVAQVQPVFFLAVVAGVEVVLPVFAFVVGDPALLHMRSLLDLFAGVLLVRVSIAVVWVYWLSTEYSRGQVALRFGCEEGIYRVEQELLQIGRQSRLRVDVVCDQTDNGVPVSVWAITFRGEEQAIGHLLVLPELIGAYSLLFWVCSFNILTS